MSQTADIAIAAGVAVVMLPAGAWLFKRPEEVARANDTRGPAWVRNYSPHGPDPARPGRTTPTAVKRLGVLLLVMGGVFACIAIAGGLGVDLAG